MESKKNLTSLQKFILSMRKGVATYNCEFYIYFPLFMTYDHPFKTDIRKLSDFYLLPEDQTIQDRTNNSDKTYEVWLL